MDFLDKIGNIAKNIGDRTNDAIEITKLNAKIASEKNAVAEDLKKIGEFYYKKFAEEEPIDTEIQEFCDTAAGRYEVIDQAQAEIDRIKKENGSNKTDSSDAQKAEEEGEEKAQASQPAPEPEPEAMVVCPSCHAANPEGLKYCTQCGSSLEPEKAAREEKNAVGKCSICGEPLKKDAKFCGHCGAAVTGQ